jgi:hypothetical protein
MSLPENSIVPIEDEHLIDESALSEDIALIENLVDEEISSE